MAETRGLTGLCTSSMAELSRATARTAAKADRPSGLALAKCEGLPRDMLESGRIPGHVFERMDFLWKASDCLSLTSPSVSRIYSLSGESSMDQLRKLCAHHESLSPGDGPLLPEWVSDSLCASCGGVLTPGVNCRVRVRHRSLASPSVKRAKSKARGAKKAKCLNEVVTTCLVCGGINAKGGTVRRAHDKKRRRRGGGGDGRHAAGLSGDNNETPAGKKRTRVAANLRGNFIPLGATNRASTTTVNTPAKNKKPSRPAPAQSATGGSHRDGVARSNRNDGGGGIVSEHRSREADSSSRIGFASRGESDPTAPPAGPAGPAAAVIVAGHRVEGASSGNKNAGGGTSGGAGGAGGVAGGEGKREPQTTPPALSLLERIRRDAKKKRRQDAAAAASAADAVRRNNRR